jgi:hypothetical protein
MPVSYQNKRFRGPSGLSIALPGLRGRERTRDRFHPFFSALILCGRFRAVVFVFPIQLVGEMDSVRLFEQGDNPRPCFAFLGHGAICIHHISDTTARCRDRGYSFCSHGSGTRALPWSPSESAFEKFRPCPFTKLLYEATYVLAGETHANGSRSQRTGVRMNRSDPRLVQRLRVCVSFSAVFSAVGA